MRTAVHLDWYRLRLERGEQRRPGGDSAEHGARDPGGSGPVAAHGHGLAQEAAPVRGAAGVGGQPTASATL
eukprot:2533690-Heterocapsa_arctica.AAC.1